MLRDKRLRDVQWQVANANRQSRGSCVERKLIYNLTKIASSNYMNFISSKF